MENKKSEKKNKKIAIIAIIAALLAAAVILCVLLPKASPAAPDESAAPTESADPASPDSSSKPGATKPDNKPSASANPEASAAPTESAAPTQPGNTGNNNTNTGSGSQTTPGQTGGSTGNQSSTNTGNQNSGTQTGTNTGNTEHQHSWQPVYKTVHHDEKGHYETVVVQAAWDEQEYELRTVCNACGYMGSDVPEHIMFDHDGAGSYGSIPVATGNTIHHEAVTEQQWVVDAPAYDEQVIDGYKCSCGQEKLA